MVMNEAEYLERQALVDRVCRAYSVDRNDVHLKPLLFLVGHIDLPTFRNAIERLEEQKLSEFNSRHPYICDSCLSEGYAFPYGTGPRFPQIGDKCTNCGHEYTSEEHQALINNAEVEIIYSKSGWPIAKKVKRNVEAAQALFEKIKSGVIDN